MYRMVCITHTPALTRGVGLLYIMGQERIRTREVRVRACNMPKVIPGKILELLLCLDRSLPIP